MIASLGMYDRPETSGANDRFWAAIRDGLRARDVAAPQDLTRGDAAFWTAWEDPDLTFSQTCGYPYRARLHGKVALLGTPDYGLPGCPPGTYNSVFVVRADDPRCALTDFRTAPFAFNEAMSQSGWAAPQNHAAGLGFHFRPALQTGAHRASALAVAEGRADIAAIDALSFALCQRYDPFMGQLREIARTEPTPALPYIAAKGENVAIFRTLLAEAVSSMTPQDRSTLCLHGIVALAPAAYLAIPNPPPPGELKG